MRKTIRFKSKQIPLIFYLFNCPFILICLNRTVCIYIIYKNRHSYADIFISDSFLPQVGVGNVSYHIDRSIREARKKL